MFLVVMADIVKSTYCVYAGIVPVNFCTMIFSNSICQFTVTDSVSSLVKVIVCASVKSMYRKIFRITEDPACACIKHTFDKFKVIYLLLYQN